MNGKHLTGAGRDYLNDDPTEQEWGSIEEIDTSGEDKLEQILKNT